MFKNFQNKKLIEKLSFSPFLIDKTPAKKIAYIAVVTAILTVANTLLEIRFLDVQFSLTITLSAIAGVVLGPFTSFISCVVADAIGYIINSWGYLYMPWVGLTTAVTALSAGLIFNFVRFNFKGGLILKLALACLSSFILGTVLINSTGFYFYNYAMGFSTAVINYVKEVFGTSVGYFGYIAYRLIFKGQILNCLVNYALIFILTPIIINLPVFKKDLEVLEKAKKSRVLSRQLEVEISEEVYESIKEEINK